MLSEGCRFDARGNVRSGFRHHDVGDRRVLRENNRTRFGLARDQRRLQRDPTIPDLDFFSSPNAEELPVLFQRTVAEQFQGWREERAWKVFAHVPRMLMHRVQGTGSVGRDELASRGELFVRGRWLELLASARTKILGSPGARTEGPGLTSQAGIGRFAIGSQKRGDFEGAP